MMTLQEAIKKLKNARYQSSLYVSCQDGSDGAAFHGAGGPEALARIEELTGEEVEYLGQYKIRVLGITY